MLQGVINLGQNGSGNGFLCEGTTAELSIGPKVKRFDSECINFPSNNSFEIFLCMFSAILFKPNFVKFRKALFSSLQEKVLSKTL